MDIMTITSIEFSERVLEKYLKLFSRQMIKKRYDELYTSYTITGQFDFAPGELKSIFKRAEKESIFIALHKNGQTLTNSIGKCYFFFFMFSVIPLLIALLLTAGSYVLYSKKMVPEEVFLAFAVATCFLFVYVNMNDILNRMDRKQMINNNKNT